MSTASSAASSAVADWLSATNASGCTNDIHACQVAIDCSRGAFQAINALLSKEPRKRPSASSLLQCGLLEAYRSSMSPEPFNTSGLADADTAQMLEVGLIDARYNSNVLHAPIGVSSIMFHD